MGRVVREGRTVARVTLNMDARILDQELIDVDREKRGGGSYSYAPLPEGQVALCR